MKSLPAASAAANATAQARKAPQAGEPPAAPPKSPPPRRRLYWLPVPPRISIERARRMALHAQGLATPPHPGAAIADAVWRIGCLQLDPVAAVARSPLLVLNARMRRGANERALDEAAYTQRVL